MQRFGTYHVRTAVEVALHCCTGVRRKVNVSSSWDASHLAGSWWTIRLLTAGVPHSSAAACTGKIRVLWVGPKVLGRGLRAVTAQGETPDHLCHTSPTGDSVLFWGRTVIQPWPISFHFKREMKSSENLYFHVIT